MTVAPPSQPCGFNIALLLTVALASRALAVAPGVFELPAPDGESSLRAVAVRAGAAEQPDGSWKASVTVTLLNADSGASTSAVVRWDLPEGSRGSASLTLGGEPLAAQASQDGVLHGTVKLEGGELAVLQASVRLEPELLPGLPADQAGWHGTARGPLLQPLLRLKIAHAPGSPFADAPLEVTVELGKDLPANALLASAGASFREGVVFWQLPVSEATRSLEVVWPVDPNETLLPITAQEARAFRDYWSSRSLSASEVRRVRELVQESGAGGESSSELMEWEGSQGSTTLAQATAPRSPASPPRTTPASAAPGPALPQPRAPGTEATARPKADLRPGPAADLSTMDDSELVRVPPDESYKAEALLQTRASVPSSPGAALRWVARGRHDSHGVSRAVLARESVLALHGKTWAPGYVSDFFRRKAWYAADPSFSESSLSDDEKRALEILEEWVAALQASPPPATEVATASPPAQPTQPVIFAPGEAGTSAAQHAQGATSEGSTPAASRPALATTPASEATAAQIGGVPWCRTAADARLFLARERRKGEPERTRLEAALAVIDARSGRPFDDAPALRARFEQEQWFVPRAGWLPGHLSLDAREAATLLRVELESGSGR